MAAKNTVAIRSGLAVLLMLALAGCGAHGPGSISDTYVRHRALVRLAVTVGVQRVLVAHPQHRALVIEVTSRAQAVLKTGTVDVMQVLPFALDELDTQRRVPPDVRQILDVLAGAILEEVQGFVDTIKLPSNQLTALMADVLGWMEDAARGERSARPQSTQDGNFYGTNSWGFLWH